MKETKRFEVIETKEIISLSSAERELRFMELGQTITIRRIA